VLFALEKKNGGMCVSAEEKKLWWCEKYD
jgi:hypothetical protein